MAHPTHPQIILVAIDNSPRAVEVVDAAVEMARRLGGKIVLLRAVGLPLEVPHEALFVEPATVPEMLERIAREDLERKAVQVPAELLSRLVVTTGTPWEVVCRTAKEVNADLVVIGSHGYSRIDRLLGTTASRIVNHLDRSVLIVRTGSEEPAPAR